MTKQEFKRTLDLETPVIFDLLDVLVDRLEKFGKLEAGINIYNTDGFQGLVLFNNLIDQGGDNMIYKASKEINDTAQLCNKCIHLNVCEWIDEFGKVSNTIGLIDKKEGSPINIHTTCKEFIVAGKGQDSGCNITSTMTPYFHTGVAVQ